MILYATDSEEEVTLFFKNTNSEGEEFKVHLYPIEAETRIRFFFANNSAVYQTEWITAKPRPRRKPEPKTSPSGTALNELSVEENEESPKVVFTCQQ